MNILMSLMQLDIGGAETHVVELAKELKRRGHKIVITSNGGAYVEELEKNGIKHCLVPLQNKKPQNVAKAFSLLKKIITDEKIDVVHSHARIPSFILGRIKRKMHFPFVTTAHGTFSTKYGLKYITDWGDKTLAVSDDIKKYLMDNYGIKEEDITITVNGIDDKKFSPDVEKTDAMREFALEDTDNAVVYVSRLDASCDHIAYMLIESVKRLSSIVENLKCIIVGDGDDFENVKKLADEVNEAIGKNAIIMTGARTDVNKVISPAKLFVGVSRAALEAMSCGKPAIIAGTMGYIGLFDETKLDEGLYTNFCCRGCQEATTDLIAQDIGYFFGLWDDEQKKLGEFARQTVLSHYSVKRMADDAEKVYKEVM